MQRVENCSNLDMDALKHVEKQITSIINKFDAMSKYHSVKELEPSASVPANKNTIRQTKFYSTKKKRKQKSNVRFAKPTAEDKGKFLVTLKRLDGTRVLCKEGISDTDREIADAGDNPTVDGSTGDGPTGDGSICTDINRSLPIVTNGKLTLFYLLLQTLIL